MSIVANGGFASVATIDGDCHDSSGVLAERVYDAVGRVASEGFGVVENTYVYDVRSRPVSTTSRRYRQWLDFTPGGNVSRMTWHADVPGEVIRSYDFDYDALSRLTSARYSDENGGDGRFDTSYEYDLNGNIMHLTRRGAVDLSNNDAIYGVIDDLIYDYKGNQVTGIFDSAPDLHYFGAYHFDDKNDSGPDFQYDANGNTVADLNRIVGHVRYDVNNRPRQINFMTGAQTRYIYSADGVKLLTEHLIPAVPPAVAMDDADAQTAELTDAEDESNPDAATGDAYAASASSSSFVTTTTDYCGPFVYEDGVLERINLDNGYLSYRDASGNRLATPQYHIFQRDHLGNNRMDLCVGDASFARVNHYYPFGLPMYIPGSLNRDLQRWKFGNKEFDRTSGLDLYDFDARAYDPATIRFYRPDDLAHNYHQVSSYVYCLNNPLINIDKDGKEVYLYATKLPGGPSWADAATHTFIAVLNPSTKEWNYFAYGSEYDGIMGAFGGKLSLCHYKQDMDIMKGHNADRLKAKILIEPPMNEKGVQMSEEEFANKVIDVANSFGNNPNIGYFVFPHNETQGNCNTSSSTILHKAGVPTETIKEIRDKIPEFVTGFGDYKPWTNQEQKKAVERQELENYRLSF